MKVVIIDKDGREQQIDPSKLRINNITLGDLLQKFVKLENEFIKLNRKLEIKDENYKKMFELL
jgi:hypothetical protein